MKTTFVLTIALAIVSSTITGRAADPAPTPIQPDGTNVVARVNGKEIKRVELNSAMRGMMMQFAQNGRSIPPQQMDQFEHDVLDELINRELVLQEASAKPPADLNEKVDAEAARVEKQVGGKEEFDKALAESGITREEYRGRLHDNIIVQGAMTALIAASPAPSPAELKEFYDNNQARFQQPELVRARHILLRTPATASAEEKEAKKAQIEAVLTRLKAGEDFATLAKQFSEDPGSAANGGDLGLFPRGAMVPEFDAVAFSMQTNQVSDVITTQFGYHILQVTEKKPARLLPLDEVKDQLAEHLKHDKGAKLAQAHIAELRKNGKVEVLLPAGANPSLMPEPAQP